MFNGLYGRRKSSAAILEMAIGALYMESFERREIPAAIEGESGSETGSNPVPFTKPAERQPGRS